MINSFFERHPYISLKLCSEIIKCPFCFELNLANTKKYINNEKQTDVSLNVIRKVYVSIRNILYKYMSFIYLTDKIGLGNKNQRFSVDESAFTKISKKENVWMLGIINNSTK